MPRVGWRLFESWERSWLQWHTCQGGGGGLHPVSALRPGPLPWWILYPPTPFSSSGPMVLSQTWRGPPSPTPNTQGSWATSRDIFGCHSWGGAPGIRDTAPQQIITRPEMSLTPGPRNSALGHCWGGRDFFSPSCFTAEQKCSLFPGSLLPSILETNSEPFWGFSKGSTLITTWK